NYGDLEQIIIVMMPEDPFFATLSGKTLALVLITPWNMDGKVASEETVFMTSRRASVITNVHSIQATVGLVETCKKWEVIDRLLGGVSMSFVDKDMGGLGESE
ncbi:hypothetical protein HD554DRAFT_1982069, partial [Boletus coccyginus]